MSVCFVCLILFFMSHQQYFSYKGIGLPGLNQNECNIIAACFMNLKMGSIYRLERWNIFWQNESLLQIMNLY